MAASRLEHCCSILCAVSVLAGLQSPWQWLMQWEECGRSRSGADLAASQVLAGMAERSSSGLRIEVWDPVEGSEVEGKRIGPAILLQEPVLEGGHAGSIVGMDKDGDACDLREACSCMFLPEQELCTTAFLHGAATWQDPPYRLDISVNGLLSSSQLHPWAKAVAVGDAAMS